MKIGEYETVCLDEKKDKLYRSVLEKWYEAEHNPLEEYYEKVKNLPDHIQSALMVQYAKNPVKDQRKLASFAAELKQVRWLAYCLGIPEPTCYDMITEENHEQIYSELCKAKYPKVLSAKEVRDYLCHSQHQSAET